MQFILVNLRLLLLGVGSMWKLDDNGLVPDYMKEG